MGISSELARLKRAYKLAKKQVAEQTLSPLPRDEFDDSISNRPEAMRGTGNPEMRGPSSVSSMVPRHRIQPTEINHVGCCCETRISLRGGEISDTASPA
jgi:hypothetical protein